MSGRARGIILPVVLVLVGLLALIMAGFMFFVNAEISGVQAQRDGQQARLIAESGLEEVITILRASRDDPTTWWDVPERFRHALVWAEDYLREDDPVTKMGSRTQLLESGAAPVAWRYSVVADNLDGPPDTLRYGVTPEASKLNLNAATDTELEALLTPLLLDLQVQNAPELIAALLDWRDEDDEPRPGGAENEYYNTLEPAYLTKNGPFETLEELLLVKGWTAAMLYGEDTNRNGYLDPNEDDGDASFPAYDNGDGLLNRGVAAYLTIWSREPGTSQQQQQQQRQQQQQQQQQQEEQGEANEEGDADADKEADKRAGWQAGQDRRQPGMQEEELGEGGEETTGGQPPPTGQQQQTGQQTLIGRVNVNTAPLVVLKALDGMPPEAAEAIVTLRREQSGDALKSLDWLVSSGAMDAGTLATLKDKLTVKALQFHVEIVGYGDHTKLAQRLEWIIELRGSLAQVLYRRDLTALGFAWRVDDDTVMVTGQ